MLMNMKELLAVANEHNFAIPAFNIGTGQMLTGIIAECEAQKSPVILAIHPSELKFQGDAFIQQVIKAANDTKIPCVIHLDHSGVKDIERAIRDGFTSVMIDEMCIRDRSMEESFHKFGLSFHPEMMSIFNEENDKIWQRIEKKELSIADLPHVRWQTILPKLGLQADGEAMEKEFKSRLHTSEVPVEGADVYKRQEYVAKTNIPEGQECYDAACELADAGCDFIFADSFGHEDYVIEAAKEYPEVQFSHATGTKAHTEGLDVYKRQAPESRWLHNQTSYPGLQHQLLPAGCHPSDAL